MSDEIARLTPPLATVDRWWRAANYLSVGQIYLRDNPLLREPLGVEHVKNRLLGHWGTTPGLNFIWAHLNRVLIDRPRSTLFVCGPGHGGPAMHANAWLEGSSAVADPDVDWSMRGLTLLMRRFSTPYGVPSHASPDTPGSMHEGGELGYSLAHAYGAAFDAPGELVACVIGDGEAETGPLATSWHSHHFLQPGSDGQVLPILHLNGYKIANPTILARLPESQLTELMRGYGHEPFVVSGSAPAAVHEAMAQAFDQIVDRLDARADGAATAPPMLILRTPKGWTGPESINGQPVEGTFRSHQVPFDIDTDRPDDNDVMAALERLEQWMRSYRPEELFEPDGAPSTSLAALRPDGGLAMSANPRSNGGTRRHALDLPPARNHMIDVTRPNTTVASATTVAGSYLADVIERNLQSFRLFGPDEVESNRLSAVFEVTGRRWMLDQADGDEALTKDGRVMEVLSEHLCQGWLEGYLLTGRHGIFTTYEAFVHIVDSMFNQHAKWIEASRRIPWRRPVSSFNYLLTSHVWRQDHNGFSHQDPGFLDVVLNKKPAVTAVYLPPDANSLVEVLDRCLRSLDRVNVIVAGKQQQPQYLSPDDAERHVELGAAIWDWAGSEAERGAPDVVLAAAGDVPTMETLAAANLLTEYTTLSVRVVNVVDLRVLRPSTGCLPSETDGVDDATYDGLFGIDLPVVFAFHGYPWTIHRLAYRRHNHDHLHVRGYVEEGSTTTPFDMTVRNRIDRFSLAIEAIDRAMVELTPATAAARRRFQATLADQNRHIRRTGADLPGVTDQGRP